MVLARAVEVGRHVEFSQINLFAAHRDFAGLDQIVFKVGVAQVPGIKRPWQIGRVAVPVKQVKGRRRFTLEVVAHHVVPDQVVGPEETEGGCQVFALEQATFAHFGFTVLDRGFVNEDIQNAGVSEVEQRSQQCEAFDRLFATRGQHGQRCGQDGAAHTKAQGVDGFGASQVAHHINGLDGGVLDVVIPGFAGHRLVGIAPAQHKGVMTLRHGIANQRIVRLQIQYVVLVDARGHKQEGPLIDLVRQRLVLQQLEKFVFKNDCAFGGGNVFAHFKDTFVGHGNMTLLHIVQHVCHAPGNAFALALDGFFLRFGVERQKIAGCRRGHPLFDSKAQTCLGFGVAFHGVGQTHQGARVEKISGAHEF